MYRCICGGAVVSDDSIQWVLLWRSGWSDVVGEDERSPPIHCLFCAEENREWPDMEDHMKVGIIFVLQFSAVILFLDTRNICLCLFLKTVHSFSLGVSPSGAQRDFYCKVKAVNYIRRQMHFGACPCCSMRFSESEQLRAHMEAETHCRLPDDKNKWSQSQ